MKKPFANREEVTQLRLDADHIDLKTIASEKSLHEFLFGLLHYTPFWLKALMGIRMVFARALGISKAPPPSQDCQTPENLCLEVGKFATFFETKATDQNSFWLGGITESHLTAHLAVELVHLEDGTQHFHVETLVHYHHWTGPVYFHVIRPFHHIVLWSMMRFAAKNPKAPTLLQLYAGVAYMLIAVLHTVVGVLLFAEPLLAIGKSGGWNAVGQHWDRNTAFWFLLWGFLFFLLGAVVQWMIEHIGRTPAFLGWSILAMCALGVFLMPESGFWLGFPVAIATLRMEKYTPASTLFMEWGH